jgi:hypothetical protein
LATVWSLLEDRDPPPRKEARVRRKWVENVDVSRWSQEIASTELVWHRVNPEVA